MTLKRRRNCEARAHAVRRGGGSGGFARTVAEEYREMEDGHHAATARVPGQGLFGLSLVSARPGAYEQLKQDPFWDNSRQKPKDLTTSKWVLLFIMRAETRNARTRASTYAKILDGFARKKVRADQVPERIKALGGVEDAYDHFLAEERGLQTSMRTMKRRRSSGR